MVAPNPLNDEVCRLAECLTPARHTTLFGDFPMLRALVPAAGLLLCCAALAAQEPLKHTKDSLETVKAEVKAGKAVLLDVREKDEWDAGHLRAARLAPQSKLNTQVGLDELLRTLPKDKVIYTHCR